MHKLTINHWADYRGYNITSSWNKRQRFIYSNIRYTDFVANILIIMSFMIVRATWIFIQDNILWAYDCCVYLKTHWMNQSIALWKISYRSQGAKENSQTSALAPVCPGTSILQVPNTMPPPCIVTARSERHHKAVALWRHFLPHKTTKQREAVLS